MAVGSLFPSDWCVCVFEKKNDKQKLRQIYDNVQYLSFFKARENLFKTNGVEL